jgi:hypothetical protein
MFGISFWKILLLVVAIVAVWRGFRWFERMQANKQREAARAKPQDNPQVGAQDMVACRTCGAYVVSGSARACGRNDCPYPR